MDDIISRLDVVINHLQNLSDVLYFFVVFFVVVFVLYLLYKVLDNFISF